ncbi:MAG: HAMP domain-containing protein [Phascolarctobacterium sp.]|nr:HAMP domain-containing protein [Phascolarctobacterium sp.]
MVDAERNLRMDTPQHPLNPLSRRSAQQDSMEMAPKEAYMHLSPKARENIEGVFSGGSFTLEEFNPVIEEIVLTMGVPVYNKEKEIRAAVLVTAPMQGMREVADRGIMILLLSCLSTLIVAFLLSIIFSWRFTKSLNIMKGTATRLADRDYDARCNIKRSDEMGDLAKTIDILSERLKLADEESQKLEQMRQEFIANVSNDLRTPVTVIRGSLEAIKDGIVTDAGDIEKYHEQMLSESVFL